MRNCTTETENPQRSHTLYIHRLPGTPSKGFGYPRTIPPFSIWLATHQYHCENGTREHLHAIQSFNTVSAIYHHHYENGPWITHGLFRQPALGQLAAAILETTGQGITYVLFRHPAPGQPSIIIVKTEHWSTYTLFSHSVSGQPSATIAVKTEQ